ncbi:P-II family nitrogen regulator [Oscillospiraceae bacterium HV4-5-C5C]|nr:P-II family nitrogen regulator [Oscillospiraceae bacterium HV4-5-C5C]
MKEVMAFLRTNKVNDTKRALAEAGFPSFTCRRVLGRGRKSVDPLLAHLALESGELPANAQGESLTEHMRLIPKRFFTVVVTDQQAADEVIQTIIRVNQTGSPGDGKIFVIDIPEAYRVRTGDRVL